ncbi:hypothetical protein SAMN04487785_105350 [Dyella jiangningensis]|uniref:hypothetical protein n=1 Tax=Dyella sp. AtDHG13 TaxID=1938897 RepID=UPI0008834983|nr:hypothetical protein [Dyella sp. AtDHG13]PXV52295.1 hypothetical protein BDW41_12015 [Dyella sp. AtDHG13]SDK16206.1 hypothetical protein SAMN04487785_105350 [Dyella jiangningensis]
MTTPAHDEIIQRFYRLGISERHAPRKAATAEGRSVEPQPTEKRNGPVRPTGLTGAATGKTQRKRTREQQLLFALARLLASRMR